MRYNCWKCEGSGLDPSSSNKIAVVCNICEGLGALREDHPSVDQSDFDDDDILDDDDDDWELI